jgi:hypothetical protein
MKLSAKTIRFVIEALEHYRVDHERRTNSPAISDDEVAEITNDRQFLIEVKKDFETLLEAAMRGRNCVDVES